MYGAHGKQPILGFLCPFAHVFGRLLNCVNGGNESSPVREN